MSERAISIRKPLPPSGLPNTPFPLAIFAKDLVGIRRVSLSVWARRNDWEDLRDIGKRVNRLLGRGMIPGRKSEIRDLPCEPVDLVLTVAGLLWPGLDVWDRDRKKGLILADLWWGRWGANPGAAVLRDGVLHLIHMDRDADKMAGCEWAKWAAENWRGPILYHGIQWAGEDKAEDSPLVSRFLKASGKSGAHHGCILWASTDGLDLRPWRVDIGAGNMLLRPLSEGFRIASTPGAPLGLRNEFEGMKAFWAWAKSLVVPPEMRTEVPEQIFLELPAVGKPKRGNQGATRGQEPATGLVPLLSDAFSPEDELRTEAEKEFGERIGPDTDPERLSALAQEAGRELMRATMSHNRRNADRWRGILNEIEGHRNAPADISPHPGGSRPTVAP